MNQLFVSTYQGFDLIDGRNRYRICDGVHYGITWSPEEIYVSYNLPHEPGTLIKRYNADLTHFNWMGFSDLSNVHQILWYDGLLYVTDTAHDRLAVWDGEQFSERCWETGKPAHLDHIHLNSIWIDGQTIYVCEHGYKLPPPRIRIFNRQFRELACVEMDVQCPGDLNAHNVYVAGDYMYVCRHEHIDVRNRDGVLQDRIFPLGHSIDPGCILRGLARVDGTFYIGASAYAAREDRHLGDSKVLILDDDLILRDEIVLEDSGQIYEVRVTDVPDYAHNMVPCPLNGDLFDV